MQMQINLEDMRDRLHKRKKVLVKQVEIESTKVLPTDMTGKDRADLAYDYEYRAHRTALLNRLEEQADEVDKALKRIEEGTFGVCSNCGDMIMPERLDALPHAAFCIKCQQMK